MLARYPPLEHLECPPRCVTTARRTEGKEALAKGVSVKELAAKTIVSQLPNAQLRELARHGTPGVLRCSHG